MLPMSLPGLPLGVGTILGHVLVTGGGGGDISTGAGETAAKTGRRRRSGWLCVEDNGSWATDWVLTVVIRSGVPFWSWAISTVDRRTSGVEQRALLKNLNRWMKIWRTTKCTSSLKSIV
jgi:hypothetical protein